MDIFKGKCLNSQSFFCMRYSCACLFIFHGDVGIITKCFKTNNLYECFLLVLQSDENEFVPLLVALCVSVVETRGLQTQGIYRIPGNKAAVTHLTEMINKGPKAIDYSDPR